MGLVIATRRPDEWRGVGSVARMGERFESLQLTEFGHEVVFQALLALPNEIGGEALWCHAEGLHRLTEGLPALLVRSVQWARIGLSRHGRSDRSLAFDEVARDYIEKDLLSADSLLPMGGPRTAEALAVLRGDAAGPLDLPALHPVAPHLPSRRRSCLREALATPNGLARAVGGTGRTALQPNRKRRRSGTRSSQRCAGCCTATTTAPRPSARAAHTMARRFYGGWTQDGAPDGSSRWCWWSACGTRRPG